MPASTPPVPEAGGDRAAAIAAAVNLEELLLYKNKVRTVDPAIGQLKGAKQA